MSEFQRMTWKELIAAAAETLTAAGVSSPWNDARLLAAHILKASKAQLALIMLSGYVADTPDQKLFNELVSWRAERFPLQYLTGVAPFRYLELEVGPGVLIPRPETEGVTQLAVDWARRLADQGEKPIVVDLGTGSGAIALSIAVEVPQTQVYAVELSQEALIWARKNVDRMGAKNITVICDDLAKACPDLSGCVDIVISNPPYIPESMVPEEPEVRDYEPGIALYGGGETGMVVPCSAINSAVRLLRAGGYLVIEHAQCQAAAVVDYMNAQGIWDTPILEHSDLSGRARATSAYKIMDT